MSAPGDLPRAGTRVSTLEARHRVEQRARAAGSSTGTRLYRGSRIAGHTRCRMFPGDAQAFDLRVHDCGVVAAVYLAAGRLLTEVVAGPATHAGVLDAARWRWLDLPEPGACAP